MPFGGRASVLVGDEHQLQPLAAHRAEHFAMPCSGCGAWVGEWIFWRRCDCEDLRTLQALCFRLTYMHKRWPDELQRYYFFCSTCFAEDSCHAKEPAHVNADWNMSTYTELEDELHRWTSG